MTADIGLRGLDLLDAVIAHIEQHPETWEQDYWRCGTAMCIAGWTAEMAGGEWVTRRSGTGVLAEYLVATADDLEESVIGLAHGREPGRIHVADRAARLLGFYSEMCAALGNPDDERDLFGEGNTLADIKQMRDDLRAHFAGGSR